MKKIIAVLLATLMIGATFASCGAKEKVCDACKQTYTGKSYSVTYMGRTLKICQHCNIEYQEIVDLTLYKQILR